MSGKELAVWKRVRNVTDCLAQDPGTLYGLGHRSRLRKRGCCPKVGQNKPVVAVVKEDREIHRLDSWTCDHVA